MDQNQTTNSGLARRLGLLGLVSTGVCSMVGASIYVVPFMIQRNVPGIGPFVVPAFLFAAVPALLSAFAFGLLASGMPRAGGSYIYASRGLSPYLGFVASFSQWFGLSFVIGVVAYVLVPFLRDIAAALSLADLADLLDTGLVRVGLSVILLWIFVIVNIRGVMLYERIVVPLMVVMLALGAVVIVAGFTYSQEDFITSATAAGKSLNIDSSISFDWKIFLSAAALLFASFIGFDSIAQAGGEAKFPSRTLPLAILITIVSVSIFYILFTWSVYKIVPWSFIAAESMQQDITAPGLMRYILPGGWTAVIIAGAAVALINDLPTMLLSVSRLMFAWSEDGLFSKRISRIHTRFKTPYVAIVISGAIATLGIFGSHFAGDFFLGIDIMVTSMQVNFLLMCFTVIHLPKRNPEMAQRVKVLRSRKAQLTVAWLGIFTLVSFLVVHVWKDFTTPVSAWYFHSTYVWLIVMAIASLAYWRETSKLKRSGADLSQIFNKLPAE